VEEVPGCVHGGVEGRDFDFVGLLMKYCAVLFFIFDN